MGDHVIELQRKYSDFRKSLYREEFLGDQFKHLQLMKEEMNPYFLDTLFENYFEDTERVMGELAKTLSPEENEDFEKMDYFLRQLNSNSSSLGIQRVDKVVLAFRDYCRKQDINRCSKCLIQLENEYTLVKERLETMFKLEKEILAAGGRLPPPELIEKPTKKHHVDPTEVPSSSLTEDYHDIFSA